MLGPAHRVTVSDAVSTLEALKEAIDQSDLRVTCKVTSNSSAMTSGGSATLTITQMDAGPEGDTEIVYKSAEDLHAILQGDYKPSITNFTGGTDMLPASKGSYIREIPTRDGRRVYSDSLLTSGSYHSSFNTPPPPSLGTFQTEGRGIRPKYYLNTRKHGMFTDFKEQGKDSKTRASIATNTGIVSTITDVSLGAPVKVVFVSGSVSDTTGIRKFVRVTPIDNGNSWNRTPTSHYSGSIYIDDPSASGTGAGGEGS